MLSVTQLAKRYQLSRATILHYEKKGLLEPKLRSENGYRWYGDDECNRLKVILSYRSFGLPLLKISELINRDNQLVQEQILLEQLSKLEHGILELRQQQKAIVQLLDRPQLLENEMVTKKRWVEIMQAAGFRDDDMTNWHKNFERMEPKEHQKFLESLGIEPEEIKIIRDF